MLAPGIMKARTRRAVVCEECVGLNPHTPHTSRDSFAHPEVLGFLVHLPFGQQRRGYDDLHVLHVADRAGPKGSHRCL